MPKLYDWISLIIINDIKSARVFNNSCLIVHTLYFLRRVRIMPIIAYAPAF